MSLMISSFRLAKVTTILIGEYGLILMSRDTAVRSILRGIAESLM